MNSTKKEEKPKEEKNIKHKGRAAFTRKEYRERTLSKPENLAKHKLRMKKVHLKRKQAIEYCRKHNITFDD